MTSAIKIEHAVPYGLGKVLDIYRQDRAERQPVVLLWHGVGPDERHLLEPLARAAASTGLVVFVPDWRSDAPDGGRAHLLSSLSFTRQHADTDAIVLAGWSRGGRAAAGIAVNPAAVGGWRPTAVVCLASGFRASAPTTGNSPAADLARTHATPVPFWLVHGISDPVVNVSESRKFAASLKERGWPVRLEEMPADHAGVVMTVYDPDLGRCRPTGERAVRAAGQLSAEVLRMAAG